MGTAMPVLCPICPKPLPRGLRLVSERLGQKYREGKEEGETKERRGDEAKTGNRRARKDQIRPKLLPNKPYICAQLWGRTLCPSEKFGTRPSPGNDHKHKTKEERGQDKRGKKNNARPFR